MRALGAVIVTLIGFAMLPATAPAAPMDGSAPMLCALSVPPFVRITIGAAGAVPGSIANPISAPITPPRAGPIGTAWADE